MLPFFRAEAEARGRDRITRQDALAGEEIEALLGHGNADGGSARFASQKAGDRLRSRMTKKYHVAIVGATGAVGLELLRVMERRNFPVSDLRLLASPRSAGKTLEFRGEAVSVAALAEDSFAGIDLAFFSAGAGTAKALRPDRAARRRDRDR